jgi:chromosome segregation ATPase
MTAENGQSDAEWVSLKEAAELTGKTVKTMRRWAAAGRVLTQKDHRGRWFLRRQDLEKIEPVAEARGELVALTEALEGMQATFHALAEDLAAATERAGRAEAETEAAKVERDRFAYEVEELRVTLKAEEDRRWWQRRRSPSETVSHVPPHLLEPRPLDPDQLEVRKAKLESLRDGPQELSDSNNDPAITEDRPEEAR